MLSKTQTDAIELIIVSITKEIEKCEKKAAKEKAKRDTAKVVYKGETYYSEADLQDAYACDMFSSSTYDRLLDRLARARGASDVSAYTPSELMSYELQKIRNRFSAELREDRLSRERQAKTDIRIKELMSQGCSFREAETIVGNEELVRYA